MNRFNKDIELAIKFSGLIDKRIRQINDLVSNAKSIGRIADLGIQGDFWNRQFVLAIGMPPSENRTRMLNHCYHKINECNNSLNNLGWDTLHDELISMYIKRFGHK